MRRTVVLMLATSLVLALSAGTASANTKLSIHAPKSVEVNEMFKLVVKGHIDAQQDNLSAYYDSQKCAKTDSDELLRPFSGNAKLLINKYVHKGDFKAKKRMHFNAPFDGYFCAYLANSHGTTVKRAQRVVKAT